MDTQPRGPNDTPAGTGSGPRHGRTLLLGMLAWLWSPLAIAQIFASTDADGTVVLSNHRPDADAQVLVDAPQPVTVPVAAVPGVPAAPPPPTRDATVESVADTPLRVAGKPLAPMIRDAARRHAVPQELLTAMVAVESGFDESAVSAKGAMGLMQLMPATARRFGVKNAFVAQQNLDGGAAYMRVLMDQFSNDLQLALAAYNAGEGAVLRAGRRIPAYPETQRYVRKVLARLAAVEAGTRATR